MYKLFIVDDKKDVTEGIIKMGKWQECGFEVAGKAYDGNEAYERIKEVNPDVVVTDIRMPKMDGIELTALIKQHYPNIKVIILSGYDDFGYAQQAVKLGAEEYLLKPARIDMIRQAVLRAREKLDKEKQKKDEEALLHQKLIQSLPLLKDEYFRYRISNSSEIEEQQVKDKFNFLEIQLDTKNFIVMIIELDNYTELYEFKSIKETELYKFGISNIASELIGELFKNEIIRYQQDKIVILANYNPVYTQNENMTRILQIAEQIKSSVEKHLEMTVTIAVGNFYSSINDIQYSFMDAEEALAYKLYLGGNCVIAAKDLKLNNKNSFKYPVELEKDLLSAVKIGAVDQIDKFLDQYFEGILQQKDMSPDLFKKALREFVVLLCRSALQVDDNKNLKANSVDYLMEFEQYKTVDEIKKWLGKILENIAYSARHVRKSQSERDIEKAKQYIGEHYNEQISLQKVAEYVCISPTYFSAVFKESVGETFIEFLIHIRIEKAKELLLSEQYKVYEVANMVGYSDRRYFSELFKKHTGMNPGEYVMTIKHKQS